MCLQPCACDPYDLYGVQALDMETAWPRFSHLWKTGKQADFGLFAVICPLCIRFYDWKFRRTFLQVKFISPVRQFCEEDYLFMAMPSKHGKI